MSSATKSQNILQLIRNRELNDHIRTKYALKSNMDYKCISKLGLLAQFKRHGESVNCLQWNESGSILASSDDDHQVILWDPFLQKVKTTLTTLHHDSIYSVKFIPGCNDNIVATGSGDWSSHTYNVTTGQKLSSCICSQGIINRLAVANDSPGLYWCASEDGCISQHDMRMSHECATEKSKTTLVTIYGNLGEKIEAKCLDINQLRTEQLAVGANDQYVRLYDRRMIQSLSSFNMNYHSKYDSNVVNNTLQYFVPGHMHSNDNETKKYIITYLTFNPDGKELLANYGCECVYLYNLVNRADNAFFNIPKVMKVPRENIEGFSTDLIDDHVPVPYLILPNNVLQLKLKANYLFEKEDYTAAILLYNEALNIHECGELFSNRAAAYIKRKWHGDLYAALKDCVTALKLEPYHMEAHFQLAVSLFQLDKLKDSKMYLDQFTMNYPSYKTSVAYKCLYSDLLNALSNNKDKFDGKKLLESLDSKSNVLDVIHIEQAQKTTFEKYFRNQAKDYHRRYYGHINIFTDNKEANFFGSRNQFIVAGSDDGLFFVWDKNTEENLLILKGDNFIVNCIQPHPSEFLLATSGLDMEVKLWSPLSDEESKADLCKMDLTQLMWLLDVINMEWLFYLIV
ncbi:WD and tetratricopeptide repeats protein 1-like [Metopolophium dirhodum]|uniref:WD and tetratricopeptide repeats protein 1-like n=1 Tax=Metopolophium dirhodum TaxID=44670 RepID=UPI0029904CCA|nr:WD and tetratricopeptide repeats protein 1-like [Metopolophium dirhodum]